MLCCVRKDQCNDDYVEIYTIHTDSTKQMMGRYCSTSSPGPVVSPRGTVGIELFLHTDKEAVYSGFKGRYVVFVPSIQVGQVEHFHPRSQRVDHTYKTIEDKYSYISSTIV